MQFLIHCKYEYYCQGWEETHGYFLVTAESFEKACRKLRKKLKNAYGFENNNVD